MGRHGDSYEHRQSIGNRPVSVMMVWEETDVTVYWLRPQIVWKKHGFSNRVPYPTRSQSELVSKTIYRATNIHCPTMITRGFPAKTEQCIYLRDFKPICKRAVTITGNRTCRWRTVRIVRRIGDQNVRLVLLPRLYYTGFSFCRLQGNSVIRPVAFKPGSMRFTDNGERYGSTPILARSSHRHLYGSEYTCVC